MTPASARARRSKATSRPSRGATAWLNSPPLTAAGLRGKVVLVDFWTYTCINWLRTLPYVRAWAEKYKDQGLVVIGVHSPEFAFEKDLDNVRRAAKDMRVDYPVAIDSDYAIWRAFDNSTGRRSTSSMRKGRIRHHQFGEGEYERVGEGHPATADRGRGPRRRSRARRGRGPRRRGGGRLGQPEVRRRTTSATSAPRTSRRPAAPARDKRRVYAAPARLRLNQWALSGDWTVGHRPLVLNEAERADRLPLSRARSSSRHGAGGAGHAGAISRAHRWTAAGRRARRRRGRAGQRHRRASSGCIS